MGSAGVLDLVFTESFTVDTFAFWLHSFRGNISRLTTMVTSYEILVRID